MFHTWDKESIIEHFSSNETGLTREQVAIHAEKYGANTLIEGKKRTLIGMFFDQMKNVMILVLLAAAIVSGFTNEITDAIIILVVVLLNAVLGVIQESRAEKAIDALKQLSSPHAKVMRDSQVMSIRSEELVPGDIVLLEAGDWVPADMRLIHVSSLKIEESALTGESLPVEKTTETIEQAHIVVGDRINMAFSGSNVTYGRGTGIVTAIGMETEVGKIAGQLASQKNEATPLQVKIAELSKYLTVGILVISTIIFITGMLQGRDTVDMLLTAITLAVAAIPEGLPAVITIVLTLGVQRMAKKNAIIRRLSAVETLGSTNIICSDKTGTLTQNRMTVQQLYLDGQLLQAEPAQKLSSSSAEFMLQAMTLCNDSKVNAQSNSENTTFLGDPTETALTDYALSLGMHKEAIDARFPRIDEIPFDSDRKLMSTMHRFDTQIKSITKGAPDVLIARCTAVLIHGEKVPLTEEVFEEIKAANEQMASKALRSLAVAYKDLDHVPSSISSEAIESDLVFIGLVGMIDPPREEAKAAIQKCIDAGIRTIMITGDHKDTAVAIAKELRIIEHDDEVIVGSDLAQLDEEQLDCTIEQYSVYARVSPEHKVRIVDTWKKKGKIIAMTGDGVNDAPALKAADIGIGMGITGTDVAKGASDMVLADDNFATIVESVEEGRKIYSNIRKSIQFLFSSNLSEILTLFIGTLVGWTVLFPIHILWINLVTDTLPALALGVEKAENDLMKQRPRKSNSSIFTDGVGISILYQGAIQAILTLLVYFIGMQNYTQEVAVTMAFVTLGLLQLTHSLNVRSSTQSIFSIGVFSNHYLIGAIFISATLQVMVVLLPFLNPFFRVVPLTLTQWLIVLAAAFAIIPIVEIIKLIVRVNKKSK